MLELLEGDTEEDPEKRIENNIVFSDEKLFRTSPGVPSVWVPNGMPTPTVARHRRTGGAMAWLGFSARWSTPLFFVNGKINCGVYVDILEAALTFKQGEKRVLHPEVGTGPTRPSHAGLPRDGRCVEAQHLRPP